MGIPATTIHPQTINQPFEDYLPVISQVRPPFDMSPSIPSEQWAQVIEKQGSVTYKKIPVPKPGPDEVLVNVKYSGVCHTDLHAIAIDAGDEKKKLVEKLGAQTFIDFTKTKDLVADVKAATPDGLGPSACLLLAVSEKPFQQATAYLRSRGVVVCIGLPANASISAPVFDTVVRMINIRGSYVGNRADTAEAIDFFRRGLIQVPSKTVGLSKLQDVYELMEAGKIAGRYVVDTSK